MKKLIAAVLVTASLATPAMAQMPTFTEEEVAAAKTALTDLDLDKTTYLELWCGAALVAYANYLKSQGDTAGSTTATDQSNVLFASVETRLASENYAQEQLEQIGHDASVVALTELQAGKEEFTQEECGAAVQAH